MKPHGLRFLFHVDEGVQIGDDIIVWIDPTRAQATGNQRGLIISAPKHLYISRVAPEGEDYDDDGD